MLLLQGGTQSDLRIDGELVMPVSEQGISVYFLNTGTSKGFCSLANTISADITANGVYICTTTQIYFLAMENISGDSTADLQLLSITPPSSIVKLCAEKTFLSFISSSDVTVTNLTSLVSRTLSVSGIAFLASYKTYIAFATSTRAYTFCVLASTFSLTTCYSPVTADSSFGLTLIDKVAYRLLAAGENVRYSNVASSVNRGYCALYFGSFIRHIALQMYTGQRNILTDWHGFSEQAEVFKYIGLDGLDNVLYHRDQLSQSMSVAVPRPGYWHINYTLYKLYNEEAAKDTRIELVEDEYYTEIGVNSQSYLQPDAAIWATETVTSGEGPVTTNHYFTLPDETYNSFYRCTSLGWIETTNKIYGWVVYFHAKDTDPSGTFSEPRLVLCIYNKNTHAVSCAATTFREEFLQYLPDQNTEITYYASQITPFGSAYCFADKRSDSTAWSTSGKFRKLVIFTVDEATDSFTIVTSQDILYEDTELTNCYIFTGETCLYVYINLHIQTFRVDSLIPITYAITALELGPGLAIADNGVGIHYMGLTGNWKRIFSEVEQITAMSIGSLSSEGDKLAYLTPTASKVIDI